MLNGYSISVIIPVFNGEKYIASAIESVLSQTYKNVEILVIDDGSTDRTEKVVGNYKDKVKYIKKNNGGVASALNVGLREMKGDYFSWLSHDDFFYPEKLEKQMNAIMRNPTNSKFIYTSYDLFDVEKNEVIIGKSAKRQYGDSCQIGTFPALFGLINGCTVLIDRSVFDDVGWFDEELITAQDYDMWFRILRKYNPVYINESLVCNRLHAAQGSRTIKSYFENCQSIQNDMICKLNEKEINVTYGGMYKFLCDMLEMAMDYKWKNCINLLKNKLVEEKEPRKNYSLPSPYLYGAGCNGKKLLQYCLRRGIKISGFIDRDEKKQGREINDVPCISIDDIPMGSEVWIAVFRDEGLKCRLIEKGLRVKDYSETVNTIYNIFPHKQKLLYMADTYLEG